MGQFGAQTPSCGDSVALVQILEKEVHPLVSGFYDTPFITWLLKTQSKYRSRVFFEDQIGINRHFVAIDWGEEATPLVAHFAGGCPSLVPCIGQALEGCWAYNRAGRPAPCELTSRVSTLL